MHVHSILKEHIPSAALEYCMQLANSYNFKLELSYNRKSKFGHYKYWPASKTHTISINKGLSKELFLITFIHEIAHMEVYISFGKKEKPHGSTWKYVFKQMMLPLLNSEIYNKRVEIALHKHFKNPKASLAADPALYQLLLPEEKVKGTSVADISEGHSFIFKHRIFKKINTRRTRALCYESRSKNNYLIPLIAQVEPVTLLPNDEKQPIHIPET